MSEESSETRVVREDPEPLKMTKRRVRKEDGRYLIYYDFDQSAETPKRESEGGAP